MMIPACWIADINVSPHVLNGYANATLYALVMIYAVNSDTKEVNDKPSTLLFLTILRICGTERIVLPAITIHPTITASTVEKAFEEVAALIIKVGAPAPAAATTGHLSPVIIAEATRLESPQLHSAYLNPSQRYETKSLISQRIYYKNSENKRRKNTATRLTFQFPTQFRVQ